MSVAGRSRCSTWVAAVLRGHTRSGCCCVESRAV